LAGFFQTIQIGKTEASFPAKLSADRVRERGGSQMIPLHPDQGGRLGRGISPPRRMRLSVDREYAEKESGHDQKWARFHLKDLSEE
jgi:hypothetical protein